MAHERRLFAVGDLCVDVLQGILSRPVFGEEHALNSLDFSIGGNAANFSVFASKLGLEPVLVSAIGKDFATSFLKKGLKKAHVGFSLVESTKGNAFSVISIRQDGGRAILSKKNCLSGITASDVASRILSKVRADDVVFFGGFYHLKKLRAGFVPLLKKLRAKKAIVCFDTCFDTANIWTLNKFFPFIDFLFTNEVELKHIVKGNSETARVQSLLKKVTGAVILKRGRLGVSLFVKGAQAVDVPAIKAKAVDTTGAGDAFNAGFVFGLMNRFSLFNCMRAGNFVASKTIVAHGLVAAKGKGLMKFISSNSSPIVSVFKNHSELSKAAAAKVIELVNRKPNASIALPTGETPKKLYSLLVGASKRGEVDFRNVRFFALDEYAGLSPENKNSFSHFLMKHFLLKVRARHRNVFLLDGSIGNLKRECRAHESAIKHFKIDLCLLGIGQNGHIAFNEPGSSPKSATRVVRLSKQTRKVNGGGFKDGIAPAQALTVGLKTIVGNSRSILLLASGKNKAKAVRCALKGGVKGCPAAVLRPHFGAGIFADRAAAAKI